MDKGTMSNRGFVLVRTSDFICRMILGSALLALGCSGLAHAADGIGGFDLDPKPVATYVVQQNPSKDITLIKSEKDWKVFWRKLGGAMLLKESEPGTGKVINSLGFPGTPVSFKEEMVLLYSPVKNHKEMVTEIYWTKAGIHIVLSPFLGRNGGAAPRPFPKFPPVTCFLLKKSDRPLVTESIEDYITPNPVAYYTVRHAPATASTFLENQGAWEAFWAKKEEFAPKAPTGKTQPIPHWKLPTVACPFKDPMTLLNYSSKGDGMFPTKVSVTKSGIKIYFSGIHNPYTSDPPTLSRFLLKRTEMPIRVIMLPPGRLRQ